jgi:hypothetical protein
LRLRGLHADACKYNQSEKRFERSHELALCDERMGSNPRSRIATANQIRGIFRLMRPAENGSPGPNCPANHAPDAAWGISMSSFGTAKGEN